MRAHTHKTGGPSRRTPSTPGTFFAPSRGRGAAPFIQLSPLSDKIDQTWNTSQSKEAVLNQLAKDDAFANRNDADLQQRLATIFPNAEDLWLAQKVLHRQLGQSSGTYGGQSLTLPIELFFFKGKSSEKALVIAGVHGSERQGIEVADLLKRDLAAKQPHYNVILVPSLFPVNAKKGSREGSTPTNRNFPQRGQQLQNAPTDAAGTPLDAENRKILIENQLLIQLIERFNPSRIISIHGTRYAHQAGVFSDPITQGPDTAALWRQAVNAAKAILPDPPQYSWDDPAPVGSPGNTVDSDLQRLTWRFYTALLANHQAQNQQRTQADQDLSVKAAENIAKQTNQLATLKDRYKRAAILNKLKAKHNKGTPEYDAAVENLKQNPAVAGNKLDQPQQNPTWAGSMPGGVSLGGYAPSRGISVFTVEPAINKGSGDYPTSSLDPDVSQADRLAELQAYADAIRTILLGK